MVSAFADCQLRTQRRGYLHFRRQRMVGQESRTYLMLESEVKRRAVKALQEAGWYARRIEDSFSVGFPDMTIRGPKIDVVFAEWKVFKGNVFGPTPRQLVELNRLQAPHSRPCTCVIG